MAEKVRDLMTEGCECVAESDSVVEVARRLAELDVGAMPICGDDDKLKGMITDRDIVVKVLAAGKDPERTTARELGEGVPVTVNADDPVDLAIKTMAKEQVRRLPVLDADKKLVGIVSQADVATETDAGKTGQMVEAISED